MRARLRKVAVLVGPDDDLGMPDPGDQATHVPVTERPPPDEGDPGQLAPLHSPTTTPPRQDP